MRRPAHLPTVGIASFAFVPVGLNVPAGSTVVWVNFDSAAHTATADSGLWNSGPLATGRSFASTFATPGTYTYFCALHPSMRGTIAVMDPTAGCGGADGGGGGSSSPPPSAAGERYDHEEP